MEIDYFEKFEKAKNLGLKTEAKTNIDLFIASFNSFNDKTEWVKSYLESGEYGQKIRHELYEQLYFLCY